MVPFLHSATPYSSLQHNISLKNKQISSVPVATYAMTPSASHVQLPQPIAPPAMSPVSACAGFPPSGSGTPQALKTQSSGRDFRSMSTPTGGSNFGASPKGSPSGSGSSSSDDRGPGRGQQDATHHLHMVQTRHITFCKALGLVRPQPFLKIRCININRCNLSR